MKILITGSQGLAAELGRKLSTRQVTQVSRSTGHDINTVGHWYQEFADYDVCINCAYDGWGQVAVLETFYQAWQHKHNKIIVNIGSIVADYPRTERDKDHEYMSYRVHKQALELAFNRMSRSASCDIKLINFGPIDTDMVKSLDCEKMSLPMAANRVVDVMFDKQIKRIDLWQ